MAFVAVSPAAADDIHRLREVRERIEQVLGSLAKEPLPANVDVKRLTGRAPWSRARVGAYRVIFRPLTSDELDAFGRSGRGYYIGRVVHRRDLERVIRAL